MGSEELDPVILVGPFQLDIFYVSMKVLFSVFCGC